MVEETTAEMAAAGGRKYAPRGGYFRRRKFPPRDAYFRRPVCVCVCVCVCACVCACVCGCVAGWLVVAGITMSVFERSPMFVKCDPRHGKYMA